MVILDVGFEMLGEIVDALGQDRHLHFGRTGISGLLGIRLNDFGLTAGGYRHRSSFVAFLRSALLIRPARLHTPFGKISPPSSSAKSYSWPDTVTSNVPRRIAASPSRNRT